jgi:hypothetical protein
VKDSLKVPADLREIAAIRSGYSAAKNQMKKAQYELAQTIISNNLNLAHERKVELRCGIFLFS